MAKLPQLTGGVNWTMQVRLVVTLALVVKVARTHQDAVKLTISVRISGVSFAKADRKGLAARGQPIRIERTAIIFNWSGATNLALGRWDSVLVAAATGNSWQASMSSCQLDHVLIIQAAFRWVAVVALGIGCQRLWKVGKSVWLLGVILENGDVLQEVALHRFLSLHATITKVGRLGPLHQEVADKAAVGSRIVAIPVVTTFPRAPHHISIGARARGDTIQRVLSIKFCRVVRYAARAAIGLAPA